jgi:hypothetical protein
MIIFFTELFRRNILLRISIFLALYVTLPLIWFLPSALDGSRTFFAFGDAVEQSYAWMHRIAQSLHHGIPTAKAAPALLEKFKVVFSTLLH